MSDNGASPNPGQSLSPVGELRWRLTQGGYEVIPVGGKDVLLDGWSKRGLATEHEIRQWDSYAGLLNTSILCRTTPVLDADIYDEAAAEAVEELVAARFDSHPVLTRIGRAPKRAFVFQCSTPFRKILVEFIAPNGTVHRVEFLADGQQCVAYGRHPGTDQNYSWPHGGLLDFPRADLPGVTAESAQELVLAVTEMLIREFHYTVKKGPKTAGAAADDDSTPLEWDNYFADPLNHDLMVAFVMSSLRAGMPENTVRRLVRELVIRVETAGDAAQKARQERRLDEIPAAIASAHRKLQMPDEELLADPDLSITYLSRRSPPPLPLDLFGPEWAAWITGAAEAAACPPDYVVGPLLAAASVLIGHARWAQAANGWKEPTHLWCGIVGDSGDGKSPGADCLRRDVLPELERRMCVDFPDQLREWKLAHEAAAQEMTAWKAEMRAARKDGKSPSLPPEDAPPTPQPPRLRQSDVTIERLAALLAVSAPKGVLVERDELAGWFNGLDAYNPAARGFFLEAFGGRPFRAERQKSTQPIDIPRLAVGLLGGVQPERLAEMFAGPDDGLLARFIWFWPAPRTFRIGAAAPNAEWAIEALDRLRLLDLAKLPDGELRPVVVELDSVARSALEVLGQDLQMRQKESGGLLRSALGKGRGIALRLSLILEFLWWCGRDGIDPPPTSISIEAFTAASQLVTGYIVPMSERTYGDAAASDGERRMATLARWIVKTRATEVHVRHLQRHVRLPQLHDAETIKATCSRLVEAGWLTAAKVSFPGRRVSYPVNPRILPSLTVDTSDTSDTSTVPDGPGVTGVTGVNHKRG